MIPPDLPPWSQVVMVVQEILEDLTSQEPPRKPLEGRGEPERASRDSSRQPAPSGPSAASWAALRACESGGDYRIVSADGLYRGAYQFSVSTWQAVGGSGMPEDATPAEQDARALRLWRLEGWDPWPVCGAGLP